MEDDKPTIAAMAGIQKNMRHQSLTQHPQSNPEN